MLDLAEPLARRAWIMKKAVIVTEKPSVARALASALGPMVTGVEVASVSGHLFELELPREYRGWSGVDPSRILELDVFDYVLINRRVYGYLRRLLRDAQILIVATDNDPEGELIGHEIVMLYRSLRGEDAPYKRMRFNSTIREELIASWARLEDDLRWSWVEKAMFRHRFDLLTGAAFTRLLTLEARRRGYHGLISWGSCQTPCLNFIVEREKEVLGFKPSTYWYFQARLEEEGGEVFTAVTPHLHDGESVRALQDRLRGAAEAVVEDYRAERRLVLRPLPARTDDALRDLVRVTGVSAARLLSIMEDLYSRGYISYPRTETNRYPAGFDFSSPLRAVLMGGIAGEAGKPAQPRMGRRDDGAHPPIYPVSAYREKGIYREVWEYIARRFYANSFAEDSESVVQAATIRIDNVEFRAKGSYIEKNGFYEFFAYFRPKEERIPHLRPGERLRVLEIRLIEDRTKPPPRLTESELLRRMEESHIGTDATRASFPELIIRRGYATKRRGVFTPTSMGMVLIDSLSKTDRRLVTPETRRMVEEFMERIEKREITRKVALEQSIRLYSELFNECRARIDEVSASLAGAQIGEPRRGMRRTGSKRSGRARGLHNY